MRKCVEGLQHILRSSMHQSSSFDSSSSLQSAFYDGDKWKVKCDLSTFVKNYDDDVCSDALMR